MSTISTIFTIRPFRENILSFLDIISIICVLDINFDNASKKQQSGRIDSSIYQLWISSKKNIDFKLELEISRTPFFEQYLFWFARDRKPIDIFTFVICEYSVFEQAILDENYRALNYMFDILKREIYKDNYRLLCGNDVSKLDANFAKMYDCFEFTYLMSFALENDKLKIYNGFLRKLA